MVYVGMMVYVRFLSAGPVGHKPPALPACRGPLAEFPTCHFKVFVKVLKTTNSEWLLKANILPLRPL